MSIASEAPRAARRRSAGLALLLLLCVGPFLARPIHLDEPVFVWVARQIARDPLDFYGFELNWTGTREPVHAFMMNPPLASYYLALVASALGWSDAAVHAAFVPVALAALLGAVALAARLSSRPLIAGLATLFSPAFLASCTMAMSDTLALALWLWALVLWDRGLRDASRGRLAAAALLAGLAALSEYFALALIPLLALHAALTARRAGAWLAALALPLGMIAAYEWAGAQLYGHSPLLGAAGYVADYHGATLAAHARKLALGLVFAGGGAASLLFLAPALGPGRERLRWLLPLGLGCGKLVLALAIARGAGASTLAQLFVWCAAGVGVLALALGDLLRTRRPESALLFAWVLGCFAFASFLNWTPNARSVLPLVPAVGILVARRLDRRAAAGRPARPAGIAAGLALAAALSVAVLDADARLASASRAAAEALVGGLRAGGARVWFQGHWGFQYYAEALGAEPLDRARSQLEAGDWILRPANNSYLFPLPARSLGPPSQREFPVHCCLSTMHPAAQAGFYAATFGALPFAFGAAPPERYFVYRSRAHFDFGARAGTGRGRPRAGPR